MRSDQEENNKQVKQQSAETVEDPETNQSMHDDESIKEDTEEVKKENTIMNDENVSSTAATS